MQNYVFVGVRLRYIKGRDYVESSVDVTSKLVHYLGQFVFFITFCTQKTTFPTHT